MLSFAATTDLIAFNNAADFATGFGFDLDTPTFYEVAPQATFPCGESSNPTDCLKGGNNITNFCEDANAPGLEEDQPNLTNSATSEWGVWQGFVEASEAPAQSRATPPPRAPLRGVPSPPSLPRRRVALCRAPIPRVLLSRDPFTPEESSPVPVVVDDNCSSIFFSIEQPHYCQLNPSEIASSESSSSASPLSNASTYSPHPSPPVHSVPAPAAFHDFIDNLIYQVRAEIGAERGLESPESCSPSLPSPPPSRKRSFTSIQSSPSPSSTSSASSSPPPSSRAKKYSLAGMSLEEISLRKKEQNKIAARRYRSRRSEQHKSNKDEISRLQSRNSELRAEEAALARQIATLKAMMIDRVSAKQ
uniref:BZIP domain-containing protein n=1 Tax=Panagrellus redivivus TaxID=6233 RepID=A0A7E4ZTI3_PANRE